MNKKFTVGDVIDLCDHKTVVNIVKDDDVVYSGRVEYLSNTPETGEPHELCAEEVTWIDPVEGTLYIYL